MKSTTQEYLALKLVLEPLGINLRFIYTKTPIRKHLLLVKRFIKKYYPSAYKQTLKVNIHE